MTTINNLTATFTGADGSLGYKNGQEYNIDLFKGLLNGTPTTFLKVSDQEMEMIAYDSIISFLSNWTNIKNK